MILLFSAALLAAGSGQARAETRSAFSHDPSGAIAADLLVVRPLSLISTAAGGLIFVGTLPFTIWGGKEQLKTVGRHLVVNPALYFGQRPVGRFEWEAEKERGRLAEAETAGKWPCLSGLRRQSCPTGSTVFAG